MNHVTIVGGGLAGLGLGILLRQQNVPVTVWEAGRYPRHRVCGEFLSGQGRAVLEQLGMHAQETGDTQAGRTAPRELAPGDFTGPLVERSCIASTAAFHTAKRQGSVRLLPEPALCVSRFVLDHSLAVRFESLGGELKTGSRWSGDPGKPGVVQASGRRIFKEAEGWRWFGLKAHVTGATFKADLEMHFLPNAYVGLCRLPHGRVNVCGLFRSRSAEPDLGRNWQQWLSGPEGSPLHESLRNADFDMDSFCSVAGLRPWTRMAPDSDHAALTLGDAYGMTAPLTGNGMSIAFESASVASPGLLNYAKDHCGWAEAVALIQRELNDRFRRRLALARWLQQAAFLPVFRTLAAAGIPRCGPLWRRSFEWTR